MENRESGFQKTELVEQDLDPELEPEKLKL